MDIIKTIILGIVEGVTEYLPVSSTGHLIIFGDWLSFDSDFAKVFDIFIQSGAVLAAAVIYRKDILEVWSEQEKVFDNWKKLFVAFLPAAVVGLLLADVIHYYLFNSLVVAAALAVGGMLFLFVDKKKPTHEGEEAEHAVVSYAQALAIGVFQCFALIPGTSRSAATILGGLCVGLSRAQAAKFSFMLAVPTLGAAGAYAIFKDYALVVSGSGNIVLLAIGFFVSFVVAYFVIEWFITYLQKHNFYVFGWYRIFLGLVILALNLFLT